MATKTKDSTGATKTNSKKSDKAKSAKKKFYKTGEGKRVRSAEQHRSFRLSAKKVKKTAKPLPKTKQLFKETNQVFWGNKKLFLKFIVLISALIFLLVKGLGSGFSLSSTRQQIIDYIGGNGKDFATVFTLFGEMLGATSTNIDGADGVYQFILTIVTILVTIWLVRRIHNQEKPSLKMAFYEGMYPIIPFVLTILVITLQLIPAVVGNFLLGTVLSNGLAPTAPEKILWVVLYVILMLLSLYMILSSVFALNIVTLKGVTPLPALRSARELVLHRRLKILARFIVLAFVFVALLSAIFLPMIFFVPVLAEPLFLVFGTFMLIYAVVYSYNLYRQLL